MLLVVLVLLLVN